MPSKLFWSLTFLQKMEIYLKALWFSLCMCMFFRYSLNVSCLHGLVLLSYINIVVWLILGGENHLTSYTYYFDYSGLMSVWGCVVGGVTIYSLNVVWIIVLSTMQWNSSFFLSKNKAQSMADRYDCSLKKTRYCQLFCFWDFLPMRACFRGGVSYIVTAY